MPKSKVSPEQLAAIMEVHLPGFMATEVELGTFLTELIADNLAAFR